MKQPSTIEASIEHTSIGRIVVPPHVPEGFTLFYTTKDFDGRDLVILSEAKDLFRRDPSPSPRLRMTSASCRQVHGADVHYADTDEPTCDALWTDERNMALAIKVADCLPVTLIDAKNHVIANIHSGWRGTVQQITAKTLDAVPLDPSSTIAWLGPTIRVCCFEVGEEVASQFDERWIDRALGPKPHVDVAAFTADVLRTRGIAQIVDTGLCTRCDGSIFHSYRRDKQGGRNLAIVAQ